MGDAEMIEKRFEHRPLPGQVIHDQDAARQAFRGLVHGRQVAREFLRGQLHHALRPEVQLTGDGLHGLDLLRHGILIGPERLRGRQALVG